MIDIHMRWPKFFFVPFQCHNFFLFLSILQPFTSHQFPKMSGNAINHPCSILPKCWFSKATRWMEQTCPAFCISFRCYRCEMRSERNSKQFVWQFFFLEILCMQKILPSFTSMFEKARLPKGSRREIDIGAGKEENPVIIRLKRSPISRAAGHFCLQTTVKLT